MHTVEDRHDERLRLGEYSRLLGHGAEDAVIGEGV